VTKPHDLPAVASQFQFHGEVTAFTPYGKGHINESYLVTCQAADALVRYIL